MAIERLTRVAGVGAVATAVVMLASFAAPDEGRLISAFNLLSALVAGCLGVAFGRQAFPVSLPVAGVGIAAALLWGFRYAHPSSEPLWLGLTALWWHGLGMLLLARHRRLAAFTFVLAIVGAFDTWVTAGGLGQPLLALAGLKLLLTPAWLIWLGITLYRSRAG